MDLWHTETGADEREAWWQAFKGKVQGHRAGIAILSPVPKTRVGYKSNSMRATKPGTHEYRSGRTLPFVDTETAIEQFHCLYKRMNKDSTIAEQAPPPQCALPPYGTSQSSWRMDYLWAGAWISIIGVSRKHHSTSKTPWLEGGFRWNLGNMARTLWSTSSLVHLANRTFHFYLCLTDLWSLKPPRRFKYWSFSEGNEPEFSYIERGDTIWCEQGKNHSDLR